MILRNNLLTMDYVYNGQPFIYWVASKEESMDDVYMGQPFVANPIFPWSSKGSPLEGNR